jgi:pilus assembly protein Flp/PilA
MMILGLLVLFPCYNSFLHRKTGAMMTPRRGSRKREKGQGLVEYGLILVLVMVVVVLIVGLTGQQLYGLFSQVSSELIRLLP